jgi:cation diffusion facilitator CzcD-associated flavoprotein CzcO
MARPVSVVIVGAGFGGIAAAVELKRQGHDDIVILERGDRVGGVWRANTYPGLACDVPSHLYSYSFALNPRWTRRFSPREDIQRYLEDVATKFDVLRHVRFGQDVQAAAFDEDAGRWRIEVAGGETYDAEVLITACGQLQRASIPAIDGLDRFKGPMFHSAHWDHSQDLRGRRVAVIGTGASAIQFVPAIAPEASRLTVFQRSAPWVLFKGDAEYSERKKQFYERFPFVQRTLRQLWWHWMESLVPLFTNRPRWAARIVAPLYRRLAWLQRFVQLRGDPRLMKATKPDYEMGCKRVLTTFDWYPTLRRDNVDLVTDRVREVTDDAVVAEDGREYPADAIVFGTGFTATEFLAPMEITGRGGRGLLADAWARGAEAYLGITVPDFPNLFLLYGPNTNHGVGSAIELLEGQARYSADAVRLLSTGAAERLEVRRDVHDAFQAELKERLDDTVWTRCSSWYVTADGRVTNNWPGTQREYRERTRSVAVDEYLTEVPEPAPTTA